MRIISGRLGGHPITLPKNAVTHPMSSKIKNALFNSLNDLSDKTVLDAFAGSGALGFEALSRGAAHVVMIDSDKKATSITRENAVRLDLTNKCKITRANISSWSDNNPDKRFDIVLADPPYNKTQLETLQKITKHVMPGGSFVLSWPGKTSPPVFKNLSNYKTKNYGDAQLVFYQRDS